MSLYDIENFRESQKVFRDNRHRPITEWLRFVKMFESGKQGYVGLMEYIDNPSVKYVFKFSQYINYLAIHELQVSQSLKGISKYMPSFCRSIGLLNVPIEPKHKKGKNPFDIKSKHPIYKDVILFEYLCDENGKNSPKLYDVMKMRSSKTKEIYSLIKQTMFSIYASQQSAYFTHYDLHSNNVLVRECDKHSLALYIIDDTHSYVVPTYGKLPMIIDYGFSYAKNSLGNPLWATLCHTDIGFTSDRFDPLADPKLFLVSTGEEVSRYFNDKTLKRLCKKMFGKWSLDWESGWDETDDIGATSYLSAELINSDSDQKSGSRLFDKYMDYSIDILQSLVIIPLEKQSTKLLTKSFNTFIEEFKVIEDVIGSSFYLLYILKCIVDSVRQITPYYLNENTRELAVQEFSREIHRIIDEVADFGYIEGIDYEKMICSMIVLGKNIEGFLYNITTNISKRKGRERRGVTIDSVMNNIDSELSTPYKCHLNTPIIVFDVPGKMSLCMTLSEDKTHEFNELTEEHKGLFLTKEYLETRLL
jgi:hypothetical protein